MNWRGNALLLCLFLAASQAWGSEARGVAVVRGQYDDIEKVLAAYRIPHTVLSFGDLQDERIFSRYRAMFFPCGVDVPMETNINILSRGTSIQAVFLKEDYHEIDREKIIRNVRSFITGGGSAYFSGYSFYLLQGAFDVFEFFDDFPPMGMAGRVDMSLRGNLRSFCSRREFCCSAPHSGWITPRSVKNAEVLAEAAFETPRGKRRGPVAAMIGRERGEAYYTGYHAGDPAGIARFFVQRVVHREELSRLEKEVGRWEQRASTMIVDSIPTWEPGRRYTVPVKKGTQTVYFASGKGFYQVDISDGNNMPLFSRQSWGREFSHSIEATRDGDYHIAVYPGPTGAYAPFAIIAADGVRLVPHWRKGVLLVLCVSVIFGLVWINRVVRPRKYSGRMA